MAWAAATPNELNHLTGSEHEPEGHQEARLASRQKRSHAGIDRTYVSRLERSLENPTVEVLEQLADALNSGIVEFFVVPAAGEPPPKPLLGGRRPKRRGCARRITRKWCFATSPAPPFSRKKEALARRFGICEAENELHRGHAVEQDLGSRAAKLRGSMGALHF